MFEGIRRRFATVPESVAVEIPDPPEPPEVPPPEYMRLARKVGYDPLRRPAPPPRRELARVLRSLGVRIYPEDKVNEFLNLMCPKGGFYVTWVRLEEYDKPVPMPVLHTIDRIKEAVSGSDALREHFLAFAVSDYEAPKPDPFLVVRCGHRGFGRATEAWLETYIIEHWDEPKFLPFLNSYEG